MSPELHPRLVELRTVLNRSRNNLLATVAGVPAEAVATVPNRGAWSVAEIVEHLEIVEDRIGRTLGQLARRAETLGPETDSESVLTSLDRFGLGQPKFAISAPAAVIPTGTRSLEQSLAGLAASRARLLELLGRVSGRALGELKAPHPLIGQLDFYQWLLFIAQHEERHSIQIRETVGRVSAAPTGARR